MIARRLLMLGSVNAFLAVGFGAFGAHSLRPILERNTHPGLNATTIYETAAHYHLTHALGIILVALLADRLIAPARAHLVGGLLAGGIILFSGSLYLLAITNTRILGAITPLGGLCFLAGWLLLAFSAGQTEPPRSA